MELLLGYFGGGGESIVGYTRPNIYLSLLYIYIYSAVIVSWNRNLGR